jgi:hypothetical protein
MLGSNETACVQKASICEIERPSIMIELQQRRDRAVKQLEDIDRAIQLFTNQPALEQALTALGRINIRL